VFCTSSKTARYRNGWRSKRRMNDFGFVASFIVSSLSGHFMGASVLRGELRAGRARAAVIPMHNPSLPLHHRPGLRLVFDDRLCRHGHADRLRGRDMLHRLRHHDRLRHNQVGVPGDGDRRPRHRDIPDIGDRLRRSARRNGYCLIMAITCFLSRSS
jgi:hypothetical protein